MSSSVKATPSGPHVMAVLTAKQGKTLKASGYNLQF